MQITLSPKVPVSHLGRAVWSSSWSPGTWEQCWASLRTLEERLEGWWARRCPMGELMEVVRVMELGEERLSPRM